MDAVDSLSLSISPRPLSFSPPQPQHTPKKSVDMAEPRAPRTERDDPEDMTPTTSHERDDDSLKEEKSPGVARIEAIVSTFTSFDKILLYIGIILGSCE